MLLFEMWPTEVGPAGATEFESRRWRDGEKSSAWLETIKPRDVASALVAATTRNSNSVDDLAVIIASRKSAGSVM